LPRLGRAEDGLTRGLGAAGDDGGIKRKLIRGGVAVVVLVAVGAGIVGLLPRLSGVRSAFAGASASWLLVAVAIQLLQVAGAVVFVQLVFADEPHRLTARMGGARQGANALLPTAGSTTVSYWVLSSLGWGVQRFAERTAVMIVAPASPSVLLIAIVGLGMGFGVFAGPTDWWLTFRPAVVAILIVIGAITAAHWGHRLAARTQRRRLRDGRHLVAPGVTCTVEILHRHDWRVLGTWVDLFASIGALWACLIAVGEHLPIAVVAMSYLLGQVLHMVPAPGGVGAIDLGVTGALVLFGADFLKRPAAR
jgi:uncharacterized membrane protein YbhN (UPF0104 family)